MLPIAFLITTLLFLLLFYIVTGRNKRVLSISFCWILIVSLLSLTGFFLNTDAIPPRFLIVLLGNILFILILLKMLDAFEFKNKIALLIHALRIPVELTLYCLFLEKQVPEIMTFNGLNFDIIIGISALILFIISQFTQIGLSKTLLLTWNVFGLFFLINIVVIGIMSAPLPIQQISFEQPNIAVLHFPFVLLPSFVVPVVLITHIVSIKQLVRKS